MDAKIEDLRPYLVKVLLPGAAKIDGTKINGTGFVCHPKGYVLTCYHVVEPYLRTGKTEATLVSDGQQRTASILTEHLYEKEDLAALQIRFKELPPSLLYLDLDAHKRRRSGDEVSSFGYPIGHWQKEGIPITDGRVGAPTREKETDVIQITGFDMKNVDGGYSGAPVVDKRIGKVVGLVDLKYSEHQAFFVPLEALLARWLELRTFHDVFERMRTVLAQDSERELAAKLNQTPFIPLSVDCGLVPNHHESRSTGHRPVSLADQGRTWTLFDVGQNLVPPSRSYVMSCDAGMGKTAFLHWLTTELVRRTDRLPFLIRCQDIEPIGPDPWGKVKNYLVSNYKGKFDELDLDDLFEDACQQKRLVFLFDGLDQISSGNYASLVTALMKSVAPVIVTSRPSAVRILDSDRTLAFLRLRPFTAENQKLYFGTVHYPEASRLGALAPDLIRVPMLAFMVKILVAEDEARGVSTRTELYRRFLDHIVHHHNPSKMIFEQDAGLEADIRLAVQLVSYSGLAEKEPQIQRIRVALIKKIFDKVHVALPIERLPKIGLLNILLETGEITEQCAYFTHQSFQEFLAAEYLSDHDDLVEQVMSEMWAPKWVAVLRFLAGLRGKEIIDKIYPDDQLDNVIHSRLFYAAACWSEIGSPLPRAMVTRLAQLLRVIPFVELATAGLVYARATGPVEDVLRAPSGNSGILVDVLGGLSRVTDQLGATLLLDIIGLLDNADKRVAQSAVDILERSSERLDAALLGKIANFLDRPCSTSTRYDDRVAQSAVDILERSGERLDAAVLGKIASYLNNPNKHVRDRAANVLTRVGERLDAALLGRIGVLLSDVDPGVRYAALRALTGTGKRLDATLLEKIVSFLDEADENVRVMAMDLLMDSGKRLDPSAWDKLMEVRRHYAEGLGQLVDVLHQDIEKLDRSAAAIEAAEAEFSACLEDGRIGDLLDDFEPDVLIGVLRRLGGKRLDGALLGKIANFLDSADERVSELAAHVLEGAGERLDGALLGKIANFLDSNHERVRRRAAVVLGRAGGPLDAAWLEKLAGLLSSPNLGERYDARLALEAAYHRGASLPH
jgi:HEAT repeat protein